MGWLDPADCIAARDCLERGHALEAGRLLLNSPQRDHRPTRQLLSVISEQLVEQAAEAHRLGEVVAAWEAIHCAEQCAHLDGGAAVLRNKIAQEKLELENRQNWHAKQLEQAQAWANAGRAHSALGLLKPLTDAPDAHRLKLDLHERLGRCERYIHECRELLSRNEIQAARQRLDKARAINEADPRIVELDNALREAASTLIRERVPAQAPRPINDRSMIFAFGDHALVVSQPEVVIGNPRGESVHVPIMSRIHGRHALLVRDRGRYQVMPYSDCDVQVGGQAVTGPRELHDGDLLQFGGEHCQWFFRRPMSGSATAVLEPARPGGASVQTPDGSQFRRVVLVDHSVTIRPRPPAHIVLPSLPADELTLRWTKNGLTAEAQGGTLAVQTSGDNCNDATLFLPSQLLIRSALDEAELLGRVVAGNEVPDELRLTIRDPFQSWQPTHE